MGLGSDSEPVFVNILGQDVYLADSMQFVLEYFLRFQENLLGTYYISTSFSREDPDATHLNQFYHVECELRGIIINTAGTLTHVTDMLSKLSGKKPLPRVTLAQAIPMMPSAEPHFAGC
ncbi:hypothetical protein N1851_024682 [Merluccius polli]|uniref:Uncharacterized protein n=1 Tax=Merluccius polli TaxID=89951 RepID=A0AA47NU88_MERPO|nr:hypothetical protein N1851_024682 [Merluccius polli]